MAYIVSAQFSEYKLIFEHAVVALELALTGKVNFLTLCWLGNATLLGLLAVLWKGLFPNASTTQTRLVLMVPVCWLLFQLNYVENLDWAMCGLQSLTAILFSAAALYLLTKPETRFFIGACMMGLLAACSSANGLFLALAGLPILIRGKRVAHLAAWTLTFAVALSLYLYGYSPLHHPSLHLSVLQRATVFLSLLGAAVENRQHRPLRGASIILGLALLLLAFLALRRRYGQLNPFAEGLWIWVILSTLPIVAFRADPSLTAQLTGRYKIYSDLLLILAFAYAAKNMTTMEKIRSHPKAAAACLLLSVLFSGYSDFAGTRFLAKRLHETQTIAVRQYLTPEALSALEQARREGIYTLPTETE